METSSGPRAAPARPVRRAPGGGAVRSAERAAVPLSAMLEAPGSLRPKAGTKIRSLPYQCFGLDYKGMKK